MTERALRSIAASQADAPKRIQRSRSSGWRTPEGAVYVGRPSRWGNPFRASCHMRYDRTTYWAVVIDRGCMLRHPTGKEHPREEDAVAEAVDLFAAWLHGEDWRTEYVRRCPQQAPYMEPLLTPPNVETIRAALGGRDLACWCDLDCVCHADVLLEIANAPRRQPMDNTPDLRFTAPEICPACGGAGGSTVYRTGTKAPRARQRFEPCAFCKGKCEVPAAKACAYRMGRGMLESRVARGLSVFEMAKRLGIAAQRLSDAEHGRLSLAQTRAVFDLRVSEEATP